MTFLSNNKGDIVNLENVNSVQVVKRGGKQIAYLHTQEGATMYSEVDGLEKLMAFLNQITVKWLRVGNLILKINNIDSIRYDEKAGFQFNMNGGWNYQLPVKTKEEFQHYDKQLKEGLLIETL